MLKVGIVGLGDIAMKAYLPVITTKKVEIHLCTRDVDRLCDISRQYRIENRYADLEAMIRSGIKAAFVHTATASHFEIVKQLLENHIHVYVDKPLTYDFESTKRLLELADQNGLVLMGGFNRRYAPSYLQLKALKDPNMILMQKNRKSLPGDIRTFVFDDFIHVIDTLLFLFPNVIERMTVTGKKRAGSLYHVVVQLHSAEGATAIGIMNRDSGTVEERLEVFTSEAKTIVCGVNETTVYRDKDEIKQGRSDWEGTLYKRGFEQITEAFLNHVVNGFSPGPLHEEIRRTHQLCEQIVHELHG